MKSQHDQSVNVPASDTSWSVRPYQPGDESQVVRLFVDVFDKPLTEAQYVWKVVESPWPVGAPTVWLADTGERIVGQYAGTPMRFKLRDEEWRILHSCDVMTAADFRRQGVLTATGEAAHGAWAAAGVPFVTGMHYGGWGSRRHHLGWREQFKAVWMWHPLRPERLLARRLAAPLPVTQVVRAAGKVWNVAWDAALWLAARGIEVRPVDQPGPEFDALWAAAGPSYEALVVRDRAWVTYRYAEAPGFGYRLLLAQRGGRPVGYLVYRLTEQDGRKTGWIADLFTAASDTPARLALLRAARSALLTAGADSVRALVPAGTPLFQAFRRAGFLGGSDEAGFDVSIVPLAADLPREVLNDPNRWFFMGGDSDIV